LTACDFALKINPNQAKAYFRRAKARLDDINAEEKEYELAIIDLEKACEID
jgi:hypothetical protein